MDKSNLIKNILLVVIALLSAFWIYQSLVDKKTNSAPGPVLAPSANPVGVKSANFRNHNEVKAFMRSQKSKRLPEDYQVPEYINSGLTVESVYDTFAIRYPEFYGFGSTQLLDSISRHPRRYEIMLMENKAIRNVYDPNADW